MKWMIVFLSVLVLTSCGTIYQLNANMARTNELLCENIQTMGESRESVMENTHEIKRSTRAMREFQIILPISFVVLGAAFMWGIFRVYKRLYRAIVNRKKH